MDKGQMRRRAEAVQWKKLVQIQGECYNKVIESVSACCRRSERTVYLWHGIRPFYLMWTAR